MTLIAGIQCRDGFLVAADSAITYGNSAVFSGKKLFWYRGANYKLVIACAGYLGHARMAIERIRDAVSGQPNPTIERIKTIIDEQVREVYEKYIIKLWRGKKPDFFELIVAAEVDGHFQIFEVTHEPAIGEVEGFTFCGNGQDLAKYLAETLLSSDFRVEAVRLPVAAVVHVVIEMFRIAKLHCGGVGLDTHIVAWRSSATGTAPFSKPMDGAPLQVIQANLKLALQCALAKGSAGGHFNGALKNVANNLEAIKAYIEAQPNDSTQFMRYWLSPHSGQWWMTNMDPKPSLAPPEATSFPTAPVPPP